MKQIETLKILTLLLVFFTFLSCGGFKKVDQRQMPDGAAAKARKNIDEGRGVSIGKALKITPFS